MPEIIELSQTFLGSIWNTCLEDLVKEAVSNASETSTTSADTTKLMARTKKAFTGYMRNIDKVLQERAGQQETLYAARRPTPPRKNRRPATPVGHPLLL